MPVTVVSAPDNGAPAHQAPSKEAAKAAALEKINGAAKPDAEAPKPEEKKPDTTAASAATTPAAPAVKPQGEAEQLRAAIELERAVRSAEQSRSEAAQYRREVEQSRATDAARKQDWRRALADAGHDIESVIMDYVGGDGTAAASKPPQQPTQVDPVVAQLQRELAELKSTLANGAQRFNRDQRLESLRGLVRGAGDEFSGLSALESEDTFLGQLEALEKQEGRPFGDAEIRAHLTEFEKQTRDSVEKQLKRLVGAGWAKTIMREIAKDEAVAATTTPAAPAMTPPKTDLMNGDAAPASRVVLPRSLSDAKAQAKAKAIASLERRRSGLA